MTSEAGRDSPGDGVETFTYLCIGCPLGCRLEVDESAEGDIVEVRGFSCRLGREHAVQEHTDPRRLVTTTVAIDGARWPRLPVKTTCQVPRALVPDVCEALTGIVVSAPVEIGEVIVSDVAGTGADVVATRRLSAEAAEDYVDDGVGGLLG